MNKNHSLDQCPITFLLTLLGTKSIMMILRAIMDGESTFTGIKKKCDDLNPRSLTDKLNLLRTVGLVTKSVDNADSLSISYHLTSTGKSVGKKIMELADIAKKLDFKNQ